MKRFLLILLGIGLAAAGIVYLNTGTVFGITAFNFVNKPTGYTEYFNFFPVATTTTATSTNNTVGDGAFRIGGAKNVTMFFSRGGTVQPNTGSTLFKVQVTPDGSNWFDYNVLTRMVATTTYPNASASVTIAAATSTELANLRDLGFYAVRCIVVETTDGEHNCKAVAEF